MNVLICNAGSTSLKFKLYDMPAEKVLAEAKIERIGVKGEGIFNYGKTGSSVSIKKDPVDVPTYTEGINMFLDCLVNKDSEVGVHEDITLVERVGFKTVLAPGYGIHEITEAVEAKMEEYLDVAPAHNGPYLEVVRLFKSILPKAVLVGAFETAFHETIPLERRVFAVPYEWYEKYGFQKMGYHGASHSYVAETLTEVFGSTGRTVSCHLGGSCSLCAIENGRSVDTTFGMSLQMGICHANRCGDLDPYVFPFLRNRGLTDDDILKGLENNGGLLGISGVANDMRGIREAADNGNHRAKLAIGHFVNAVVKYIGAYQAEMGGLDNIVFTGGIGEHDSQFRKDVCSSFGYAGLTLSSEEKPIKEGVFEISSEDSKIRVLVIPANEELGVARKTYACKRA